MGDYKRPAKKVLADYGCYFLRQGGKGDHEIWYSPIRNIPFTVDGKIKKRTSANKTLKDAGINQKV